MSLLHRCEEVQMRYYRNDIIITVVVGAILTYFFGPSVIPLFLILVAVEVALSGDNATVNVRLLKLLSPRWVMIFMTIGILFAAGFMRFLFPILIVSITGHMGLIEALTLALNDHTAYAEHIEAAHNQIAIFGGVYLFMISATFFLVENTQKHWIPWLEKPLAMAGKKVDNLAVMMTTVIILTLSVLVNSEYQASVLLAGFISLVSYMAIKTLTNLAEADDRVGTRKGLAALGIFLALEAQDAAFSIDGVSGALAITQEPIVIAAGLGVGALFVRSATKHLMETNKLAEFTFLSHGAFYAILALACSQIISLFIDIPGYLVGGVSVALIAIAVLHSHFLNKREDSGEPMEAELLGVEIN